VAGIRNCISSQARAVAFMVGIGAAVLTPGLVGSTPAGAAPAASGLGGGLGPVVTAAQVELIQLENQVANAVTTLVQDLGDLGCLTGAQDPATCPPSL
jgi:hypothetical protein